MAIKTIGATGRQYSTIALWESYLDGLGTLTENEIGECYNDSEFDEAVVFSGFTPGASAKVILRAATGQGFRDAASPVLRYDQTKGVAWTKTISSFTDVCDMSVNFMELFGFQINCKNAYIKGIHMRGGSSNLVDSCIVTAPGDFANSGLVRSTVAGTLRNCLLYANDVDGALFIIGGFVAFKFYTCTFARTSNRTPAGYGFIHGGYDTNSIVKNCAFFGFSTAQWDLTLDITPTYCATDAADFPQAVTGEVLNVPHSTTTFQAVGATPDYRAKDGSGLDGVGVADATNYPTDIFGTTRADPPFIGCFEVAAAGGTTVAPGAGAFSFAGSAVTLTRTRALAPDAGGYSFAGQPATVGRTRAIAIAAGAWSIAGSAATLVRTRTIAAVAGAFSFAGQTVTITAAELVSVVKQAMRRRHRQRKLRARNK